MGFEWYQWADLVYCCDVLMVAYEAKLVVNWSSQLECWQWKIVIRNRLGVYKVIVFEKIETAATRELAKESAQIACGSWSLAVPVSMYP